MIALAETERGFKIGTFKDQYDNGCSIQESSLATEDCIWLGLENARMHLTQSMAQDIIDHLQTFVDTGQL